MSEAIVRGALRAHVMASVAGARDTLEELWVPRSNERADIALIGRWMDGFEIKTERDTLNRLPRQMVAYGRLFDRCTAVVAERHRHDAAAILPDWWGITTVHVNGAVTFAPVRKAKANPSIDPEVLVRLLWRDEVFNALISLGRTPDRRTTRPRLWAELLRLASPSQLRAAVRNALLTRTCEQAKIPTRRFGTKPEVLSAGL
ncbi:MAG: sce7726 family protein [Solirubrobacteraceae bacterium]